MSGDSQTMERSTLERKDRAELAAVAEALGLKVPSRAKKSDIITLILEVVAPDSADHGGDDSTEDSSDEAAGASTDSTHDDDDDADAADEGDDDEGEAPTESDDAGGADASESAPAAAGGDRGDRDGSDGDAGGDGDGEAAAEGSGRSRRRRRRGRDRAEGEAAGGTGDFEGEPVEVSGLLDLRDDGYGFLRVSGFLPSRDDVYVSVKQCRQLGLRKGDHVGGLARPAGHKEKNPALMRVETVNGLDPEQARARVRFEELTAIAPDVADVIADITPGSLGEAGSRIEAGGQLGRGQRALLESPRGAGRTTVLKAVASAVEQQQPDAHLIVLLVDERPEDVTDVARSLDGGDVVASTFDRPSEEHAAVAELTIEHAKRLVEYGNDVVILFDGLTRLARAYNLIAPAGGRPLAGGLDTSAVHPVKRFFGAARNLEEGGSLTILATVAVDTPSSLDAEIRDELDGTANLEVRLAPRAR